MTQTGSYCKAYPVERFKAFTGWSEKPSAATTGSESPSEYPHFFLQENFTVTRGIYVDEEVVFDEVTDAWKEFCRTELQFEVPDYAKPAPKDS